MRGWVPGPTPCPRCTLRGYTSSPWMRIHQGSREEGGLRGGGGQGAPCQSSSPGLAEVMHLVRGVLGTRGVLELAT